MLSLNCQSCGQQFVSDGVGERHCWRCARALRGLALMKAGEAKRRAMPFPASETGEPVTSYTVAREADRKNAAQDWLIAYDEVKLILDNTVKVGTTDGKTMVFNKREAAAKITQIVNDRFNAKKAGP